MYTLQPEKKSRGYINVLAIVGGITIVLLVVGIFGFFLTTVSTGQASAEQGSAEQESAGQVSTARSEVVYKIRFYNGGNPRIVPCGVFGITYAVPSGIAQKEVEACKGVTEVASFQGTGGDQLHLSIQNTWPPSNVAQFSCIVEVDGKTVAEVESVGTPNIASCSQVLQ